LELADERSRVEGPDSETIDMDLDAY
jgi:hypothetical protein